MDLQLAEGTVLDERYRIIHPLGQGGFGITYLAENIHLGMRVAIKELFWRDHCSRSTEEPSRVTLTNLQEAPMFAAQMERFLREARTLRDFSDQGGIVRILDYFEANATAYIVMEFIQGETLSRTIAQEGPFPEEKALRAMLPLVRALSGLHAGGLIHRDISPENIMVRPDGSLTLIDFGAARHLQREKSFTAIGKDHYAAPEQHDQNGKHGPWTDVYGLCATLYECVTGVRPDSAVQRLFLDELRKPSALVPSLSPGTDALILKGLEMDQGKRFQNMDTLAQAMENLLPHPEPQPVRRWWILLAAALLLTIGILGAWQYTEWKQENRFYGMETLRFLLTPGKDLTARDFAAYQEKLKTRLEELAGPDRYQIEPSGASLEVTVPASVFGDARADLVLSEVLFDETDTEAQHAIQVEAEILVTWENPSASLMPGEHQIQPASFSEPTVLLVYEPSEPLTRGERASLITDLKIRLDALDTPYAFGIQKGTDSRYVIRLSPSHIGRAVLDTLGSGSVYLGSALCDDPRIQYAHSTARFRTLSVTMQEDGSRAVLCTDAELKKNAELFLRCGADHLYLMTDSGYAFLEGSLTEPVSDEPFLLDHLRFTDESGTDLPADFMFDYLDALIHESSLPCTCFLREERLLDRSGRTLLGEMSTSLYGLRCPRTPGETALVQDLVAFRDASGLRLAYDSKNRHYWLYADLPVDSDFSDRAVSLVRSIMESGCLSAPRSSEWVYLVLTDEEKNGKCRFIFYPHYDSDAREIRMQADFYMYADPASSPSMEALKEAWENLDVEAWGLQKPSWTLW